MILSHKTRCVSLRKQPLQRLFHFNLSTNTPKPCWFIVTISVSSLENGTCHISPQTPGDMTVPFDFLPSAHHENNCWILRDGHTLRCTKPRSHYSPMSTQTLQATVFLERSSVPKFMLPSRDKSHAMPIQASLGFKLGTPMSCHAPISPSFQLHRAFVSLQWLILTAHIP